MAEGRRSPARKPARAAKPAARKESARNRPARKAPTAKASARTRRRRTVLALALGAVVLVGLLFAFVYPTRTFLDQRDDLQRARTQYDLLSSENAKLAAESKRLQDPAEIERRARDYGLVKPGEQGFVIVPAPTLPPAVPTTAAPTGGTATPSP